LHVILRHFLEYISDLFHAIADETHSCHSASQGLTHEFFNILQEKRIYAPFTYKSHKYTSLHNTDVFHTGIARNIFNPKNWHLWSHKIRQKHEANIGQTESKSNIYWNSEFLPSIMYVLLLSVTFTSNIYNNRNNNNLKINYNYKV
jgi:hypothetical protein